MLLATATSFCHVLIQVCKMLQPPLKLLAGPAHLEAEEVVVEEAVEAPAVQRQLKQKNQKSPVMKIGYVQNGVTVILLLEQERASMGRLAPHLRTSGK